ncbi:MAG: hypothetical protein IPK10_19875 [Bacteroidetes bacterium]|nr:hypothetical protein [Bacteroidota bacterium]
MDKQTNSEWLAFEEPYVEYNFVYAAKNHRPFKSKGVMVFHMVVYAHRRLLFQNSSSQK